MRRVIRRRGRAAIAAAVALAVGLPVAASGTTPVAGTAAEVARLVSASQHATALPATAAAQLASASSDTAARMFPKTASGCAARGQCILGDTASSTTVALLGDSHALMWLPAVVRIATALKLRVELYYLDYCPAASVDVWVYLAHSADTQCSVDRREWISWLDAQHPAAILLSDRTYMVHTAASGGTQLFTAKQWRTGLESTIAALRPSGASIAVIGDLVTFDTPIPECLAAHPSAMLACSVPNPNRARPGLQPAERAAARAEKAPYVDPTPWLCRRRCAPVIGGFIAYYDQNHISATYAQYLSGVLGAALRAVV